MGQSQHLGSCIRQATTTKDSPNKLNFMWSVTIKTRWPDKSDELIDVGQRPLTLTQQEVMNLNVATKCYWYWFFVSCPRFSSPLLLFRPLPAAHSPTTLPPTSLFVACVCICGSNLHTAGTGIKTTFAFQIMLRNRFFFFFSFPHAAKQGWLCPTTASCNQRKPVCFS